MQPSFEGDFTWLINWYAAQCDGDWEHQYGIELGTLDNPGWRLTIDLEETPLEKRAFQSVEHNLASAETWWYCKVEERKFEAACGPRDLPKIIRLFRNWADSVP